MSGIITIVDNAFFGEWSVETFLMFSLSLQTILNVFAPFRKRTGNAIVVGLIWLVYLVADWVATFTIGIISIRQYNSDEGSYECADILAFWAPFLLLHLGGPDSITAFSIVDNALWLRHFVVLIAQVYAIVAIFQQSLPGNMLWYPTLLLLVAGTIKYGERERSLYLASLNQFWKSMLKAPDPGPNYARLMEEYSSKKEANLPTRIEFIPEPNRELKTERYAGDEGMLDDLAAVKLAYQLFEIFKGLIVDFLFDFRDMEESRLFFHKRDPGDAFKVLAIELNFMYEALYTKVIVVHSMFGYIVRYISWCAAVAALSTFYLVYSQQEKQCFQKIDVGITYTLLFGAIGMDTIALFMLAFSDWTAASIQKLSRNNICIAAIKRCFLPPLKYFLTLKRINWWTDTKSTGYLEWARQILFRRWSESLCQYNLINYCLKEHPKKNPTPFDRINVIEKLDLKDLYDKMKYISNKPFTKKLWDFIFGQLKKKSEFAKDPNTAKRISSARGDWVLQDSDWNIYSSKLMSYVVDVEFDQSLIIWHIATELCYSTDRVNNNDDDSREFCKILSDYMLYLQVMQPNMMITVVGFSDLIFKDTCAEAKKFFTRKDPRQGRPEKEHERACEMILKVNTEVRPVDLKGDRSKSVLFDACILAKELGKLERQVKWKLMSEVWVELLSYAASHSNYYAHATQLSKGGELITFVWLLMAHFGIGLQVRMKVESHSRAKLIVGK